MRIELEDNSYTNNNNKPGPGTMAGKKKRQGEPSGVDNDESSESDESPCSHINKAVDINQIRKALKRSGGFHSDCPDCQKDTTSELPNLDGIEYDMSLWLCLKCGNQACGRSRNRHAIKHVETPHSDCHDIVVNTTVWSIWCYGCDNEVNVTSKTKKLAETFEFLKKQSQKNVEPERPIALGYEKMSMEISNTSPLNNNSLTPSSPSSLYTPFSSTSSSSSTSNTTLPPHSSLARVRGLRNLGNTCFFNSVMQCLGQTPHLLELLLETAVPGQHFKLPGGRLVSYGSGSGGKEGKSVVQVEALEGELAEWRPLTRILAETLSELQSGRAEVFNPRPLLAKLTDKLPQFGGGDQHDSHELLRHLLEAVREEDLRRYQTVILAKLGLSTKTDPASVDDDKKRKIIRYYGSQASEMLLPTEQVFRGVLVSTLQCKECGHTSHRDEFFLDLSLPIVEKQQSAPKHRRKADELDENSAKPSKYQQKREKRAAKKNKKAKNHRTANPNTTTEADLENNQENSDTDSDADVEDNIEESNSTVNKGSESGYNSDRTRQSPDSGVVSPRVATGSSTVIGLPSVDVSPASSEASMPSSSLCGRTSPNDEASGGEDQGRPQSRLAFAAAAPNKNNDLKTGLAKLSLDYMDFETAKPNAIALPYEPAGVPDNVNEDEKMDLDEEELYVSTMGPKYHPEDGECSVQSCLSQFTTSELMMGANKVSCEMCTKRQGTTGGLAAGQKPPNVYRNALKQLLIYNPPAVLILHLKRFQVFHYRSAKMSKSVSFPTILDLAPFCSKRSRNLSTISPGQNQVLYSLYGVVEHSGNIHGGHYVAYVKVRSKLPVDSYRWRHLPKNQRKPRRHTTCSVSSCGGDSSVTEMGEEEVEEGATGGGGSDPPPAAPPGHWYYVSDSHVSEVTESRVLGAQAYVLFYERIH